MLKRVSRKGDSEPNAAECLAKDLDEIVKADQILWQQGERGVNNDSSKATKDNNMSGLDTSETASAERGAIGSMSSKAAFLKKMEKLNGFNW